MPLNPTGLVEAHPSVQEALDAIARKFPIGPNDLNSSVPLSGASLPASPTSGQLGYYVADATNGVVWTFRYRTASASGFKWEFVGGSDLVSATDVSSGAAGTQIPATTYTTAIESITVPLAGDYDVFYNIQIVSVPGVTTSYATVCLNGTNIAALEHSQSFAAQSPLVNWGRRQTLAAGDVLSLRARVDSVNVSARYWATALRVSPVRAS